MTGKAASQMPGATPAPHGSRVPGGPRVYPQARLFLNPRPFSNIENATDDPRMVRHDAPPISAAI